MPKSKTFWFDTHDWWKSSNGESFVEYHKELVKLGMSEEDAAEWLESIYYTVAGEFGG